MVKISRQTREIINIVIFLVVVAFLLITYVIYPLNRTKATMGRANLDDYNPDSLPVNDPALFVEVGLKADTFSVDIDINTTLACLYIQPTPDSLAQPRGTVILIHDDRKDRTTMIPLARELADSGYAVIAYDQRASGLTSGKYHGEGFYEANDLEEIIPYLVLRERIFHPLTVVGFSLGADAALLASHDEKRIDRVAAVDPYLTTINYQNTLKREHGTIWFPFFRTVMWWWYNMRSGYAAPYRKIEDIKPVACRTLLFIAADKINTAEPARLRDISSLELLTLKPRPVDEKALFEELLSFIRQPL